MEEERYRRVRSREDRFREWSHLLDNVEIEPKDRAMLRARILPSALSLSKRQRRLQVASRACKIGTAICSLLSPSLVSLLGSHECGGKDLLWILWSLGLAVGCFTMVSTVFDLDWAAAQSRARLRKLESELWLFASLAGRYRPRPEAPSHREHLLEFVERSEQLTRPQVSGHSRAQEPNFWMGTAVALADGPVIGSAGRPLDEEEVQAEERAADTSETQ